MFFENRLLEAAARGGDGKGANMEPKMVQNGVQNGHFLGSESGSEVGTRPGGDLGRHLGRFGGHLGAHLGSIWGSVRGCLSDHFFGGRPGASRGGQRGPGIIGRRPKGGRGEVGRRIRDGRRYESPLGPAPGERLFRKRDLINDT